MAAPPRPRWVVWATSPGGPSAVLTARGVDSPPPKGGGIKPGRERSQLLRAERAERHHCDAVGPPIGVLAAGDYDEGLWGPRDPSICEGKQGACGIVDPMRSQLDLDTHPCAVGSLHEDAGLAM